ncbi:hypothetical protein, conserved [Plasmodium gonderi]|uniref:NOT2/NOT3/NOT5 C-terminal domain-containing protein n=1 Tax=Plasmodium gonderi TaxID=77519 RepID=A0A1Y1JEX5_PLAGO|nr:hypothetical protein, conserved [Plasmodium gonderi]GAW81056.1 hypothetical protein, conserved [Plasmodium gonderi]
MGRGNKEKSKNPIKLSKKKKKKNFGGSNKGEDNDIVNSEINEQTMDLLDENNEPSEGEGTMPSIVTTFTNNDNIAVTNGASQNKPHDGTRENISNDYAVSKINEGEVEYAEHSTNILSVTQNDNSVSDYLSLNQAHQANLMNPKNEKNRENSNERGKKYYLSKKEKIGRKEGSSTDSHNDDASKKNECCDGENKIKKDALQVSCINVNCRKEFLNISNNDENLHPSRKDKEENKDIDEEETQKGKLELKKKKKKNSIEDTKQQDCEKIKGESDYTETNADNAIEKKSKKNVKMNEHMTKLNFKKGCNSIEFNTTVDHAEKEKQLYTGTNNMFQNVFTPESSNGSKGSTTDECNKCSEEEAKSCTTSTRGDITSKDYITSFCHNRWENQQENENNNQEKQREMIKDSRQKKKVNNSPCVNSIGISKGYKSYDHEDNPRGGGQPDPYLSDYRERALAADDDDTNNDRENDDDENSRTPVDKKKPCSSDEEKIPLDELLYETTERAKRYNRTNYGLMGILKVIRKKDPELNILALGTDLTTLGLNLNSPDFLFTSLTSPICDDPTYKEDYFLKPNSYLNTRFQIRLSLLLKLQTETLFYIFYNLPRDILQAYAASELYLRKWTYHMNYKKWFIPRNFFNHNSLENCSSWIYFDPITWSKKTYEDFLTIKDMMNIEDVTKCIERIIKLQSSYKYSTTPLHCKNANPDNSSSPQGGINRGF